MSSSYNCTLMRVWLLSRANIEPSISHNMALVFVAPTCIRSLTADLILSANMTVIHIVFAAAKVGNTLASTTHTPFHAIQAAARSSTPPLFLTAILQVPQK
jgi:hypothetical protein